MHGLCKPGVAHFDGSWVKVIAEDFRTLDQKDILSAYFTFVAVDDDHKPVEVIPVIPETPEQIRRYEEAEKRRTHRRLVKLKSVNS